MNNIFSTAINEGIDLHLIKAEKFKTNLLSLYIKIPINKENATMAALLPMVLRRGTVKYPSLSALAKHCEELYGASLYSGLRKKGDISYLYFSLEFISDEYINDSILKDAAEFLKEIVFNPKMSSSGFDEKFVDSEKINLKDNIRGIINDKKEYADLRVKEISFENSAYGISPYGFEEDLASINPENLYEFYQDIISNCKIDIFFSGSFENDKVSDTVKEEFSDYLKARTPDALNTIPASRNKDDEVKRVTERMDVTQSKLCMVMYTGANPYSDEYFATAVMNCIYGGSPFSKLFNNVREKLSLAYYVSSRLDRYKGCMLLSSGIENDKFDAAFDEIMLWLDKMKKGEFSDEEILSAKKYLETGLNSSKDSLRVQEDYILTNLSGKETQSIDEIIEGIKKVTREEIILSAKKVTLDTVYLLTGKEIKGA